jgi:hypothetical protein
MQALENIYNQLSFFLSNLFNSLLSLLKVILQSDFSIKYPEADQKQCIILGNGPSLAQSLQKHQDFFKSSPLVCVNSFALTEDYEKLKPSYYAMHDPGLWLSDSEIPRTIFNSIMEKTTWPLTLFIPRSARKSSYIKRLSNFQNIKIVLYNYTVYKGASGIGNWLYKNNLAMPQSQNVLVASLFLCLNLKFKEIYVFGADHTWHENIHVDDDNVLCIKDVHYYDNQEEIKLRKFYKGLHLKETFTVHEIFEAWAKVFKGYWAIEKYAKYCGSKIYNASEVSFIDIFERKKVS